MARLDRGLLIAFCLPLGGAGFAACSAPTTAKYQPGNGGTGNFAGTTSAGGASAGSFGVSGSSGNVGAGGVPGSGGAAGTAGASAAGGNGGTTTVVQKDCAQKFTVTNPIVADYESYTGTPIADPENILVWQFGSTVAGQGVYAGAQYWNDTFGTTTFALLAGHDSNWALSSVYAPPATCPRPSTLQPEDPRCWGTTASMWMGCVDASAYTGISFWLRGAVPLRTDLEAACTTAHGVANCGEVTFTVNLEDTNRPSAANPAGGGTCAAEPCTHPYVALVVPASMPTWTQFTIPWADFTPGASGTASVPITGDKITGMQFSVGLSYGPDPAWVDDPNDPEDQPEYLPIPEPIDLKIDDVVFTP